MTSQKIYAVLRKVGIVRAVLDRTEWSPGAYVERAGGRFRITYKVYGRGGEDRKRERMVAVVAALKSADIHGQLSEDGLTFWVSEG